LNAGLNPTIPGGGFNGPVGITGIQQQAPNASGQQAGVAATPGSDPTNSDQQVAGNGEDSGDQSPPAGVPNTAAGAVANGGPGAPGTASNAGSTFGSGNQTFGGAPIMGIASTSKDKTVRIYNKKDRYYQWQFVYDPSLDMGGLITTPYQQSLQTVSNLQPGQNPNNPNGQQQNNGSTGLPNSMNGTNPLGSPQQGNQNQNQPQTPQMPPDENEQ
jgi:hypothetical protein